MTFEVPKDRAGLVNMVKIAEQCERFDEMLVCMKLAVKQNPVLNTEEKNLLSVAYKNVVGARRAPWRTLAALEKHDATKNKEYISAFKTQLEEEIGEICSDLCDLVDTYILPKATDDETSAFFYKMKGDYYRYHVEVSPSSAHTTLAQESYNTATSHAASLSGANPIRLGLALNFSVFYYEILNERDRGHDLAKQAFEEGLGELETMPQDASYEESASIMSLLRDNLTTWTEAAAEAAGARDDGMAVEDL